MKYAGLNKNDFAAGIGVCVTFFAQGCPHRCRGCHNPETWDYNGGLDFTDKVLEEILDAIDANGIQRNFCLMGGEPLCPRNSFLSYLLVSTIRKIYPDIKIYIWSGYTYEELLASDFPQIQKTLDLADVLIDGPYLEAERDVTLSMRGSRNQRIIDLTKVK